MLRHRAARLLLAGTVTALMTVVLVPSAQAASGYFNIVNLGSGKCAEVDRYGAPSWLGALVVQRTCDGNAVQHWAPVGQSVYLFINEFSGMCMDVRDGVNADSTPVQQWACTATPSMKWTINPNSFSGVHQIRSQIGGRCLDVRAGATVDGAQIQIYRCTGFGNAAQVWSFWPA